MKDGVAAPRHQDEKTKWSAPPQSLLKDAPNIISSPVSLDYFDKATLDLKGIDSAPSVSRFTP